MNASLGNHVSMVYNNKTSAAVSELARGREGGATDRRDSCFFVSPVLLLLCFSFTSTLHSRTTDGAASLHKED